MNDFNLNEDFDLHYLNRTLKDNDILDKYINDEDDIQKSHLFIIEKKNII